MTPKYSIQLFSYNYISCNCKSYRNFLLIGLSFCCFTYLIIAFKSKWMNKNQQMELQLYSSSNDNINQTYFIDLVGCRIPYFPVTDEYSIQFTFKPRNFFCKTPLTRIRTMNTGTSYITLNINDSKALKNLYNVADANEIHCNYREIQRINDQTNRYLKPSKNFQLRPDVMIAIKSAAKIIRVDCWSTSNNGNNSNIIIYKDFYHFTLGKLTLSNEKLVNLIPMNYTSLLPYLPGYGIHQSSNSFIELNGIKTLENDSVQAQKLLSVMILGLGSLSQLNFKRQMPLTALHIQQTLDHVTFWGYNTIADKLYANLIPVLTGLDATEFNLACPETENYDNCTFIWRSYHAAGFSTVFAEDVNIGGFLNTLKHGFKDPPTDYYLRPIVLEMERHIGQRKVGDFYQCLGGQRTDKVLFEYIRKLSPFMAKKKFFSIFWSSATTYREFNMMPSQDADLRRLLAVDLESASTSSLSSASVMNRTIVFLISDHGSQGISFSRTYQGQYEQRLPLFICIFPKWLKEQFPLAVQHLQYNSRRIVTPFDIYATLLDVLHIERLNTRQLQQRSANLLKNDALLPRGISLFLPVPEIRTCESAGIKSVWCTCNKKKKLATNDRKAQRAARYVVKIINSYIKFYPQCRTLYLNAIFSAILEKAHHSIMRGIQSTDYNIDIQLRIQTKPGLALYETTVRMNSFNMYFTKKINRLNVDHESSYCINEKSVRKFCYCYR